MNVRLQADIIKNTSEKFEMRPGKKQRRISGGGGVFLYSQSVVKFDNCEEKALQLSRKLCLFPEHRDNVHMPMP